MISSAKHFNEDGRQMVLWDELGAGVPTIIAYARLCSESLACGRIGEVDALSHEALAILYAARRRGAIEVKGVNSAFDSSERFLAVCVELDSERQLILKRRDDPELTIRFLDGFRQLCADGLVMHHIYHDFSLTSAGFNVGRSINAETVPVLKTLAEEQVLGEI